jgi:hypothetical protein
MYWQESRDVKGAEFSISNNLEMLTEVIDVIDTVVTSDRRYQKISM